MIITVTVEHSRNSLFFTADKDFIEKNKLKEGFDKLIFQILRITSFESNEARDYENSKIFLHSKLGQKNRVVIKSKIAKSLKIQPMDLVTIDLIERERYKELNLTE